MTIVLAHQGGWDEILMVAVPIAVFAVLLYIANNRASRLGGDTSPEGGEDTETRANDGSKHVAKPTGTHVPPPTNPRRGPI